MKIFDIVKDEDNKEFLLKKCDEVIFPLSKEDEKILIDMVEYLKNSQDEEISKKYNIRAGVGLAANQIGFNKRMFAIYLEEEDKITKYGLINPRIISTSLKQCYLKNGEGCLSVPNDVAGFVYRPYKIRLKAYDVFEKKEIEINAKGYLAIILQHEMDHLNGILYYQKIDNDNPFVIRDNSLSI